MERVPLPTHVFRHCQATGEATLFSNQGDLPTACMPVEARGGSREGRDKLEPITTPKKRGATTKNLGSAIHGGGQEEGVSRYCPPAKAFTRTKGCMM